MPSVLLQLSRWDVAQCKSNDPPEPCPMEPWEGSLSQTGSKSHSRARFQKRGFFSALETHLPPHSPPDFTSYLCFTFSYPFFSDFSLQTLFGGEEADVKDWTNLFDSESPRLPHEMAYCVERSEIPQLGYSVFTSDFAHLKSTLHPHLQNQLSFLISIKQYHYLSSHSS